MDRQPRAKVESVLLSDGQTYVLLYLRLLKKLQRVDTQQCILVLIADALAGMFSLFSETIGLRPSQDHEERISLFTRAAGSDPDFPYAPLLRYCSSKIRRFRK